MSTSTRKQRTYDHCLRELVQSTRDIQLATRHGVPASTARGWLNKPATEVVSLDVLDLDTMRLQREVMQLRRRVWVRCPTPYPSRSYPKFAFTLDLITADEYSDVGIL